ncbi:hypothetical protein ACFFMM_11300 [Micromonospora chaiyaphumensis]|uniref:hypothetical protein n=1 Tax=Micromonospora chaiyaphumensis TaxID=307119 RepID=UPI0011130EB1|nr:hypothetical protein [Micromonospora chaiyaphumensis]
MYRAPEEFKAYEVRPHLDHLLEEDPAEVLLAVPAPRPGRLDSGGAYKEVVAERAGTVELAENGSVPRRDRTTERAYERRYGTVVARDDAPDVKDAVCCGKHLPGRAGQPLGLGYQICPDSPTYYQRDERDGPTVVGCP